MTAMNYRLLIILLSTLISCNEKPIFKFKSTADRFREIIEWGDKIIVVDNIGDLYEIKGDSMRIYNFDSIVSISKCKNEFYILKAPNDTTLIITRSNGTELIIKNKSGFKSKYFNVWTNERCEILFEAGMVAFKIQEDSFIDLSSVYGFEDITSFYGSDKFGYFDNFIFLTKYADYFGGGIFQTYLDGDSNKYRLPTDIKVRDFAIYNDELWLATGFYETMNGKHTVERMILKIKNGKVEEVAIKEIPNEMDIASIYLNESAMYLLSERLGFFELKDNRLRELISIDLRGSKIIPESFIFVKNDLIFLSTFNNGVLRFTIKDNDFDVKQLVTSE